MSKEVPIELLDEKFELRDGKLFWKNCKNPGTIPDDRRAGCFNNLGYRRVIVDGLRIQEHRVIFAMTHRRWPAGFIDHINGDRADNRPENLREATQSQNMCNAKTYSSNTSGYRGVVWEKRYKSWRVQLRIKGKHIHLGNYDDLELAAFVYEIAAEKFHGKFARPTT